MTDGYGARAGELPVRHANGHDPVGWPTFKDWPAPESLTHEGTYCKWMERSWRGGQRILVNLLVENNKLCELYPLKRNSCDDMDSIRLQAKDMYAFQDYIDAQNGGPGQGWYRIVTSPPGSQGHQRGQARRRDGHRDRGAVRLHQKLGVPDLRCSKADHRPAARRGAYAWASRQMELVNKFDNALAGVAGDSGSIGSLVNSANILETGSPWRMRTCNPNDPEVHDKDQDNSVPVDSGQIPAQDALFGAVAKAYGVDIPAVPVYPAPARATRCGLTELGEHTIRGLAEQHMIFDPDHMSVKARQESIDLIEELGYPGSCPATRGPRRTPIRGSTNRRASSRRTPGTAPASWRSGSAT